MRSWILVVLDGSSCHGINRYCSLHHRGNVFIYWIKDSCPIPFTDDFSNFYLLELKLVRVQCDAFLARHQRLVTGGGDQLCFKSRPGIHRVLDEGGVYKQLNRNISQLLLLAGVSIANTKR
jgi:hypothetical protein